MFLYYLTPNFMKSSGKDSSTNFLDSAWESFLKFEYLVYQLPLPDDSSPAVSLGFSIKRIVHWDTKVSLMITITFWYSQHDQETPSRPSHYVWCW